MDINEFADFLSDSLVEVNQKVVFLLEEGMQVVSVILKERACILIMLRILVILNRLCAVNMAFLLFQAI